MTGHLEGRNPKSESTGVPARSSWRDYHIQRSWTQREGKLMRSLAKSDSCKSYLPSYLLVALSLIILLTTPSNGRSADQPQPAEKPATVVDQYTPDFPGPSRSEILKYTELEKLTNRLPSLYRIRNAPSTGSDPTWSGDTAAALRGINRADRKIGQDMRRLDDSIRRMNTSINRTRTIRRSRGF